MPTLKDIRKRIASVKNIQKITRAMKLVAAAKLRRAQDAIHAARPYSLALAEVVAELAESAGADSHPLLAEPEGSRTQIVVMTSDRGLAGSFNAQICRTVEAFVGNELVDAESVGLRIVGRKGRDYFKRRQYEIVDFVNAPTGKTALDFSREAANKLSKVFVDGEIDQVFVVYNEFRTAISQKPRVHQLLPVRTEASADRLPADFLFEPSRESLLNHLVPLYLQNGLYRGALESIASEFGSRMSAMDSATRNAGEMIDKLTLDSNRARQAAITKELLEIIGGAEALKG